MSWLPRGLFLLALGVAGLPALAAFAQEPPPQPDDPSPASRHAQVIAQGVAVMPGEEVTWRVAVTRALPLGRALPAPHPAGFVLATAEAVALVDDEGNTLARIAPGEAVWIAPGRSVAVVSLEGAAVDALDIALLPAASAEDGGRDVAIGDPFPAPAGEVFDIDLVRDVLARDEESVIPAGAAPSLLMVTDGTLWVSPEVGEPVELTAGGVELVGGAFVLRGASRAPAAFIVARIGPALPAVIDPRQDRPAATPVALPEVSATLPPPVPEETDSDGDGLSDDREISLGTDPTRADSDDDGLSDRDEVALYGTEALDADTDDDGLDDAAELLTSGSSPFLADSDGDGISDPDELAAATNPSDDTSVPPTPVPTPSPVAPATPPPTATPEPAIATPSGVPGSRATPESLPVTPTLLPATPIARAIATPGADLDGDGLSTADEVARYGTNPTVADTDRDGIADGAEIAAGTDPNEGKRGKRGNERDELAAGGCRVDRRAPMAFSTRPFPLPPSSSPLLPRARSRVGRLTAK